MADSIVPRVVSRYFDGHSGRLKSIYSKYAARSEQIAMADMVQSCMEKADNLRGERCALLPIQGDTGIGKSLAALIPMLHQVAEHRIQGEAVRCAYATFTTQLRRQLAEGSDSDLQVAIRAVKLETGIELKFAEYWGAAHYLSQKALESAYETATGAAVDRIEQVLKWMKDTEDALMVNAKEALHIEEHEPLVPGYADTFWGCSWREARNVPAYQKMREDVVNADVVLLSHAAALVNARRFFAMLDERKESGGEIRYCVFDEAHKLPDAAQSLADRSISLSRLVRVMEIAHEQSVGKVNAALVKEVRALRDALQSYAPPLENEDQFVLLNAVIPDGEGETVRHVLNEHDVSGLYQRILASVKGVRIKNMREAERLALMDVISVCDDLGDYCEVVYPKDAMNGNPYQVSAGLSWSPERQQCSFSMSTTQPGRLVARYWRHYPGKVKPEDAKESRLWGAVILSATLPPMPEIGIFNPRDDSAVDAAWKKPPYLMVPDIARYPVFEPDTFGAMDFVLSSGIGPETMNKDKAQKNGRWTNPVWEKDHLIPMVEAMVASADKEEGILILAPSSQDVDFLAGHARNQPWWDRVVIQRKGDALSACVAQFKLRRGQILISAGGWEGLNLPGMIQHLMITRLPRSPLNHVWKEILREKNDEEKVQRILNAQINQHMRAKLRQGIGRGIRGRYDHVTVWIADKRFGLPNAIKFLRDKRVGTCQESGWGVVPRRFLSALDGARVFHEQYGLFAPEAAMRGPQSVGGLMDGLLPTVKKIKDEGEVQ